MASSIKAVLRKKRNKDGSYPLAIRITKDRKSSYIYTGYHLDEKYWDAKSSQVKKSYPNSVSLNNLLLQKLAEFSEKRIDLEVQKKDTTSKTIKNNIKGSSETTFFAQAKIYIENLTSHGKYNRKSADNPRIERFREFLQGSDITFKEITIPLLNRFRAYLKGTRNVSDRTIINHLIVIRTIFNQAIKGNLVDRKYYPFGKDKIVIKFPDSVKIGLSPEEVKKIEELELPQDSFLHHSRNLWLFSFYFAGMRVSDVLRSKWTDFQNDRIYYAMGKNAKAGSLKIPEKVLKILSQYSKDTKHDLVFPDLAVLDDLNNLYEVQRKINSVVRRIDESLKIISERAKITKPLSMHIARHTFGNISGDKIPVQMLQKLYRHTHITTTIGYQANFIHKDADEALDSVISF